MRPLVSPGLYFFIMKRFFIILLFISACLTSEARKVKGSVRCGSQSIEGVIVTYGYGFAVTDRGGRFVLDIRDDAEFVHIVTPSGYVADWTSGVPAFYRHATGRNRFDFQLQKTAPGEDYHIIAVSDPRPIQMLISQSLQQSHLKICHRQRRDFPEQQSVLCSVI